MVKKYGRSLNRKGSVIDLIWVAGLITFLCVVILIGFIVTSKLNDKFQSSDIIPTRAKTASADLTNQYTTTIDGTVMVIAGILMIGSLMLAALVRIHPLFIPIFLVALIFIVFYCGVMSNIYQEMATNEQTIAYGSQLTMSSAVMKYLPWFIAVFGILLMIVQYKNWSAAQI